jgi:hypothetical protein
VHCGKKTSNVTNFRASSTTNVKVVRKAKGSKKVSKRKKYNKEKNINEDERTDYVDRRIREKREN